MSDKQDNSLFEIIFDPYKMKDNDTFDEIYKQYLDDTSTICTIDNTNYYKAARITKSHIKDKIFLIVALPSEFKIKKNCIIIDENGNHYEYKGIEMIRFTDGIPEWYLKMPFVLMQGISYDNVGQYFATVEQE